MRVAAVWRDFRTAQKLVDEHPGCNLYERARSLRSVLRIFSKSAERFFENLGHFKTEALDGSLFRRNRKSDFEEFEAGFQEDLLGTIGGTIGTIGVRLDFLPFSRIM